ncbi:MAG: Lrp/AsnC family transcriptional regulator [Pseudomonadota bacterium]
MAEEETKGVRPTAAKDRPIDRFDRKILGALARNAAQTYAAIGAIAGLSPPAVHDRVKRLRASGAISATTARLDGAKVGKPLLAFIHVEFAGWGKSAKLMDLSAFPEVEEMHSVAGDAGLIVKARTADAHALENLLAKIYELDGVKGTKTYIALSTFLERPVQAEVTEAWDVELLP